MSTRLRRWALVCFCISAGVAASPLRGAATARAARAAEIEAGLAKQRSVYLVAGAESRTLVIRARGRTLEVFSFESLVASESRHWWSASETPPVELPRLFVTAATVGLIERKVVVPPTLKPWTAGTETGHTTPPDDSLLPPPASYDVSLKDGWALEVRQEARNLSLTRRFTGAVVDGLRRVTGRPKRDERPTLRLTVDEDTAKKIYHLFRKGTAILVVDEPVEIRPKSAR